MYLTTAQGAWLTHDVLTESENLNRAREENQALVLLKLYVRSRNSIMMDVSLI